MAPPRAVSADRRRRAREQRRRRALAWATGAVGFALVAYVAFALRDVLVKLGPAPQPVRAVNSSVYARGLVTRRTTADAILAEHDTQFRNTSLKLTDGFALAFLSGEHSWRASYALALRNAAKFTHIAPRWYGLEWPGPAISASDSWISRAAFTLRVAGSRSPPLVVPAFAFAGATAGLVAACGPANRSSAEGEALPDEVRVAREVARAVASACERLPRCAGVAIDVHVALGKKAARCRPLLAALVRALSARLRGSARQLLLEVPAHEPAAFSRAELAELHAHVDAVIVRTFGFSSPRRPGPDAPLPWMSHALQALLSAARPPQAGETGAAAPDSDTAEGSDAEAEVGTRVAAAAGSEGAGAVDEGAKKLVAALRFGGHDYKDPKGGEALCNRTRYLELLRAHRPRLDWYPEASEHVFAYVDDTNVSHSVYFPTLKSLQERLNAVRSWGAGVAVESVLCGLDYFLDLL